MRPHHQMLIILMGGGAVFAGAVIGVSANDISKRDEPRAEVGSCAERGRLRRNRPRRVFSPKRYGLYDMIGNVWEWTSDWYRSGNSKEMAVNPKGPELASLRVTPEQTPSRVIKGGSYLCSMNYCSRYRPAARQPQENDLAAAHLGFRTVLDKPNP